MIYLVGIFVPQTDKSEAFMYMAVFQSERKAHEYADQLQNGVFKHDKIAVVREDIID